MNAGMWGKFASRIKVVSACAFAAILSLGSQAFAVDHEPPVNCGRLFETLLREAPKADKAATSPSKLKRIAADFGVGEIRVIRDEVREIKSIMRSRQGEFSGFSSDVPETGARIESFLRANSLDQSVSGYRMIPEHRIGRYLDAIGRDTIELLYVPGAAIPHLPKSVNRVGHLAVRVDGTVYHQTGGSGFRVESMESFLYATKKEHKVFGTVLRVSPREAEVMKSFFQAMSERQVPYSFLLNNCSQAACRAIALSGMERLPRIAGQDPLIVRALAGRSDRVALRTLYNAEKEAVAPELLNPTLKNRIAFYGTPALAATGAAYGGTEALDVLIEYLDQVRNEPAEKKKARQRELPGPTELQPQDRKSISRYLGSGQ